MITLYTAATPNGQKISIALEEFGLHYEVKAIDLSKDEQKEAWFLDINPNGRIPAIVDGYRNNFAVFETGAILLYLCKHYDPEDQFSFRNVDDESLLLQWLFFQNAGLGPMYDMTVTTLNDKTDNVGKANHFYRYAPEKIQYGIDRYQNETRRLYAVIEDHLKKTGSKYLVKDKYTVADMSTFAWVRWEGWAGIGMDKFPLLQAWSERIEQRSAVKQGLKVPNGEDQIDKLRRDPNVQDPFKDWVMKGQNDIKGQHGK